jgi:hypothetical protein
MKKEMNLLEIEYDRCVRNIIESSGYITNCMVDGDLDKVDLYRNFLHNMIDKALSIKKLLNK